MTNIHKACVYILSSQIVYNITNINFDNTWYQTNNYFFSQ